LNNYIEFIGSVPHKEIPNIYNDAFLNINLCPTGGVDKAVLEAMACGCIPITTNEAFTDILSNTLLIPKDNPNELAGKIKEIINTDEEKINELRKQLRNEVEENHNLAKLINKICVILKNNTN